METREDKPAMRRQAKDNVFCDLFTQEDYLFELYRALHPEDTATTAADLEVVTIERVVTDGEYNDLGFVVADKLVVLVEAQSEWSANIVTRMLLYLAETYRRRLFERSESLHNPSTVELPAPELYVVYTGRRDVPETVSFTRDILGGAASDIEVAVHVLRGGTPDVVGQYVEFTRVVDEVRSDSSLAPGEKAAELVRRCVERGILSTYMRRREQEVRGIMFTLFDQERETRLYHERLAKQATDEGFKTGYDKGFGEGYDDGFDKGRDVGFDNGFDNGRDVGFEAALADFAQQLRDRGVDEALLKTATAAVRAQPDA